MMHIVFGDKVICYLSDKGLREGAKEELQGKMLIDLFPNANKKGYLMDMLDADASTVPIVVLSDEEYHKMFPED